jgi:hypothetical protein
VISGVARDVDGRGLPLAMVCRRRLGVAPPWWALATFVLATFAPAMLSRIFLRRVLSVSRSFSLVAVAAASAAGLVLSSCMPFPPTTKLNPAAAISW